MSNPGVIETDYLVVGCGNAGMSFVDSLLDHTDGDVVMVDRRHAPGGHWVDCYPFVRLHQPSSTYGVESTRLGQDRAQTHGPEKGWYDRASGKEVCGYFDTVMQQRFLPTGRVQYFPMSEYLGEGKFRSILGGTETQVVVRRKTVDAAYNAFEIPATSAPPFEVADDVRCVVPGELTQLDVPPAGFVVIGSGKTAMDTVIWLLEQGTQPEAITWVRPRDVWAPNRAIFQPGHLAIQAVEGTTRIIEALAAGGTVDEIFERLEQQEVMFRLDPAVRPTMIKGATLNAWEVEQLRRVSQVVRLGKVQRIEPDRIVLDQGTVPTSPAHVHVHCAAYGVCGRPGRPVFGEDSTTLQVVTRGSVSLSSAMIARVEATDLPVEEKNRLCPPQISVDGPVEYLLLVVGGLLAEFGWRDHPELRSWFAGARLNVTHRSPGQPEDPDLRAVRTRLGASFAAAHEHILHLWKGSAEPNPDSSFSR